MSNLEKLAKKLQGKPILVFSNDECIWDSNFDSDESLEEFLNFNGAVVELYLYNEETAVENDIERQILRMNHRALAVMKQFRGCGL